MQWVRLRRLAALGLVGVVVLAGCRADPTVAAYVGDTTFTEAHVKSLVDGAASASAQQSEQGTTAPTRQAVVSTLVLGDVCERFRAEKKFEAQKITAEQVKSAEKVPASSEYATLRAKLWGCVYGLPLGEQDAPKEEDIRRLYDRAVASGQISGPWERERAQLAQNPDVLDVLARARYLSNLATGQNVTVNPRYRPLEFPLAGTQETVLVPVFLGEPGINAVNVDAAG